MSHQDEERFYLDFFNAAMASDYTALFLPNPRDGYGATIRLRTLAYMNMVHIKKLLADEVAAMLRQKTTSAEQMRHVEGLMSRYTAALKNLRFMLERPSDDSDIANTIRSNFFISANHDSASLSAAGIVHERPKQSNSGFAISEFTGYRGHSNKIGIKQRAWEATIRRAQTALFVCFSLIAPMLIMMLHPTLVTRLATASVFIVAFAGLLVLLWNEARDLDVAMASAAYAAVLVVFVGTNSG